MIEETPPLTPTQQASDLLRDAAARLERNQDAPFGGAVVILPPRGEPVSYVVFDHSMDLAVFWSTIMTKASLAAKAIEDDQRRGQVFGR